LWGSEKRTIRGWGQCCLFFAFINEGKIMVGISFLLLHGTKARKIKKYSMRVGYLKSFTTFLKFDFIFVCMACDPA